MSRRAKGTFSIAALLLVVGGFALALAFEGNLRVRWWAFRMHSGDRDVARRARLSLLEIGRPDNDTCYPELVALEIADRVAQLDSAATFVVFVGERAPSISSWPVASPNWRILDRFLSPIPRGFEAYVSGSYPYDDPLVMGRNAVPPSPVEPPPLPYVYRSGDTAPLAPPPREPQLPVAAPAFPHAARWLVVGRDVRADEGVEVVGTQYVFDGVAVVPLDDREPAVLEAVRVRLEAAR